MKHPMQNIYTDKNGTIRFETNEIVEFLLKAVGSAGIDLNTIAAMNFSADDKMQFAQLQGYSVSGWGGLSYVTASACALGDSLAAGDGGKTPEQIELELLRDEVTTYKKLLRPLASEVFGVHEEDLR